MIQYQPVSLTSGMAILLDFNTVPFSLFSLLIFANLCCVALAAPVPVASKLCDYNTFSKQSHEPLSLGKRQLPSQRPPKECRTFISLEVEEAVIKLGGIIQDPDLLRLFENSFPNTLDTAVKWKGYAKDQDGRWTDEELAFIITGDMYVLCVPLLRSEGGSVADFPLVMLCGSETPRTRFSPIRVS